MKKSQELRAAATALDAAARLLDQAGERQRDFAEGITEAVVVLSETWEGDPSTILQSEGHRIADVATPAAAALVDSGAVVLQLARTAETLAEEMAGYERRMEAALALIVALEQQLAALGPDDLASTAAIAAQIAEARLEYRRAEEALEEAVARWQIAADQATTEVRSRRVPVQRLKNCRLLTWGPRAAPLVGGEDLFGAGLSGTAEFLSTIGRPPMEVAFEMMVTDIAERRVTRVAGHWRRTPNGGRTWVRPHVRASPRGSIVEMVTTRRPVTGTALIRDPRLSVPQQAGRWLGRGSTALSLLLPGWDEYNTSDPSVSDVERAARVTTAVGIEGTSAAAAAFHAGKFGAMLGGKGGPVGMLLGGSGGALLGGFFGSSLGAPAKNWVNENVVVPGVERVEQEVARAWNTSQSRQHHGPTSVNPLDDIGIAGRAGRSGGSYGIEWTVDRFSDGVDFVSGGISWLNPLD